MFYLLVPLLDEGREYSFELNALMNYRERTNFAYKKSRGVINHSLAFYGHDGHPGAWLIWDFVRIYFRTVRDGHRKINMINNYVT